ncbi:hypothetical protein [Lactiplantibacillus modestisalitolerans]|uniref:Uncharacterized protein n=1 Tax=Lactiplantibacillus modestisalitolerans TaxID=1457219 RepID=A0ABV5WTA7_9LACO|nr:hypothetical protein [Lactiplantibacillus modestisalitolerans]
MAKQKIQINPDKFARAVVSGSNLKAEDDTRASKDALKRYLAAYVLIEKFNKLESESLKFSKTDDFALLMKGLDQLKMY